MGKRKLKKKIAFQCEVCNGFQEEPVVACDKCDKWHHFACVGIESIRKEDQWFCDKCRPTRNPTKSMSSQRSISDVASRYQNLTSPSSIRKFNRGGNNTDHDLRYDESHPYYRADPHATLSRCNISGNRSVDHQRNRQTENASNISDVTRATSNRQAIELQMIREERILSGLRDIEYLKQKYSIQLQGKQHQDKVSTVSLVSQSTVRTRNWVENQQSVKSRRTDFEINKTNVLNEDELIKRLDALRLDMDLSIKTKHPTPAKNKNQPKIQGIDDLLRCDVCQMVGKDENFEACLLCFEQYHFACMDIITIDNDCRYICPNCKNSNGPTSNRQIEKPMQSTAKQFADFDVQRCATCLHTDNQDRFRSCNMCYKSCHYSCMTLSSVGKEFIWICSNCKRDRIELANEVNPARFHRSHRESFPTFPTPPLNKPIVNEFVAPAENITDKVPTDAPFQRSSLEMPKDPNLHRCGTCGTTKDQQQMKLCDVCECVHHFSCLTLASIEKESVWMCSKCKEVKEKLTNQEDRAIINKNQPIITTTRPSSQPAMTRTVSHTLTSAQIASRHVVTKDLPIFNGQPEQWPMFLSRFENSTKLCGFSDSENLDRLQKCLKGNALDAVRSRLLTAESVPEIMSTLKMLYGRPELIVDSLLKKIRSKTPPKADQLNTMVDFALAVKNVCATLEQADLGYHLSNPALIQELVNKLPTNFKIDWARYKSTIVNVTLSTLGCFLFELASVISTVTEPTLEKDDNKSKKAFVQKDSGNKDKDADSGHVYAHQSQFYKRTSNEVSSDSRELFGANCSPASAQFVKNKNATKFKMEFPRAVESIIKNHYVDDMLDCQDTEAEMIQLIKDVKHIHSHAGFEIRKYLSNSATVMNGVNGNDDDLQSNLDMSFGTERVLGMWWNTKKDCFTYSLKFTNIEQEIVNGNRIPTKRELLKILMSIFDPLGLLSHYLIHLKMILQDVWRSNLDWDNEISSKDIRIAWNCWFELLPNVEKIEIPRLYSPKMSPVPPKSIELHIFVDAGEKAFAVAAYLRIEDDNGVDCTLVGSKTRVTPLKYLSIPRKELQAALLGSRLITSIGNAQTFNIDRRQIWSDSSTVLSWLNSDNRKYHQFVAHRVGEILEATNLEEWRWIPSKQNVADEATKWSKTPSFDNSNRWYSGPEFLKLPENEWPCKVRVKPDTLEEMKVHCIHSHLIVPILIETKNFSNWNKMHRAMAYVGRFVSILRAKVNKQIIPYGPLTRDELITADNRLIRQAQFQDFTEEMVLLMRNENLPADKQQYVHPSSPLFKCTPYLDEDGIIRVHGRIDSANNVAFSAKRPIILPRYNPITRLLVAYYHKMYHHRNHRTVYNEIRQKYYIPSLRVVLNSVRNECQLCKNKRAKAQPPQMADLPPARLAIGFRAFSNVGVDYFGPMYVVIGRRNEKRWGVLITCLTTRAVHVEIAYNLDTQSCIMCIRNFINLRGCPHEIYSDQGTNLKGMDNTLKELVSQLDQDLMASEFTTCYTKWNFNPPASPHMGGAWERMVKSVKICLYEILPTRHPTEDMLRNLLLEVCNIINSRPLTDVPLDHDNDEIITSNHFILGSSNGLKPFIDVDIDRPILRSKWMENQRLTDIFWLKFVKEFLPDLTRRTKWHEPVPPIQVDDIVLLVDGTNVRGQYPRARVIETFIGNNNQVRRARIQLFSHKNTKLKQSILWRPVTSLAKLDVQPKENSLSLSPRNRQTEGSVMNGNTGQFYATLDNTDRSEP